MSEVSLDKSKSEVCYNRKANTRGETMQKRKAVKDWRVGVIRETILYIYATF